MNLCKTFAIFVGLNVFAAGAALAGRLPGDAPAKGNVAPMTAAIDQTPHEAPVVWGRSVSVHHRSKMHHVRVKPADETPTAADALPNE